MHIIPVKIGYLGVGLGVGVNTRTQTQIPGKSRVRVYGIVPFLNCVTLPSACHLIFDEIS